MSGDGAHRWGGARVRRTVAWPPSGISRAGAPHRSLLQPSRCSESKPARSASGVRVLVPSRAMHRCIRSRSARIHLPTAGRVARPRQGFDKLPKPPQPTAPGNLFWTDNPAASHGLSARLRASGRLQSLRKNAWDAGRRDRASPMFPVLFGCSVGGSEVVGKRATSASQAKTVGSFCPRSLNCSRCAVRRQAWAFERVGCVARKTAARGQRRVWRSQVTALWRERRLVADADAKCDHLRLDWTEQPPDRHPRAFGPHRTKCGRPVTAEPRVTRQSVATGATPEGLLVSPPRC